MTFGPRQTLLDGIMRHLSDRPEIHEIQAFGSAADRTEDEYSDFDLVACSSDPRKTQLEVQASLNAAAPIIGSFVIVSAPDHVGQMFLFEGFSPYHKLDLAIVSSIETLPSYGPFRRVYQAGGEPASSGSELEVHPEAPAFLNQVNGVLFCIPRFTKCLLRQDRDVYKKWMFVLEQTLTIMYEKHFGWVESGRGFLSSPEREALYGAVGEAAPKTLDQMMPPTDKFKLEYSFRACIDQYVIHAREKASSLGMTLDEAILQHLATFMNSEINRYFDTKDQVVCV